MQILGTLEPKPEVCILENSQVNPVLLMSEKLRLLQSFETVWYTVRIQMSERFMFQTLLHY
jgi:hypothetical protein